MNDGVRIKMHVRTVDADTQSVLLPTEEYECVVEPLPHFYHRTNVVLIQAEAMAKIKYVNSMYCRITNESDIRKRLGNRNWTVEATLVSAVIVNNELTTN